MTRISRLLVGCHPGVRAGFDAGGPILVFARNSSSAGTRGREQAALDAHLALEALALWQIIDVRGEAPSVAQISQGLQSSVDIVHAGRPHRLTWTYWTWSSADGAVRLTVCAGSGRMTDDDGMQPFMERIRGDIKAQHPSLVWAKEADRFGRDELGIGRIARAIDEAAVVRPCFLGTGATGVSERGDGWEFALFFATMSARKQAESLVRRTRQASAARTSSQMEHGRFVMGLNCVLPPGLALARMRDLNGGRGQQIGYLDHAAARPTETEIYVPVRPVLDALGQHADQVDNVRWALQTLADGGSTTQVATVLHSRGFTTTGLQRTHGPGASYLSVHPVLTPLVGRKMVASILKKLDFYATGTLQFAWLDSDVTVLHCSPEAGWASPDAIAGLLRRKDSQRFAAAQRQRSSLGGIHAMIDGNAVILGLHSPSCTCQRADA